MRSWRQLREKLQPSIGCTNVKAQGRETCEAAGTPDAVHNTEQGQDQRWGQGWKEKIKLPFSRAPLLQRPRRNDDHNATTHERVMNERDVHATSNNGGVHRSLSTTESQQCMGDEMDTAPQQTSSNGLTQEERASVHISFASDGTYQGGSRSIESVLAEIMDPGSRSFRPEPVQQGTERRTPTNPETEHTSSEFGPESPNTQQPSHGLTEINRTRAYFSQDGTYSSVREEGVEKKKLHPDYSYEDYLCTFSIKRELSNKKSCPICLEPMAIGNVASVLQCMHMFHHDCLLSWFKKCSTQHCPECRQPCDPGRS